jgi:hypothetical protein
MNWRSFSGRREAQDAVQIEAESLGAWARGRPRRGLLQVALGRSRSAMTFLMLAGESPRFVRRATVREPTGTAVWM